MQAIGSVVFIAVAIIFWTVVGRGCDKVGDVLIDKGMEIVTHNDDASDNKTRSDMNPVDALDDPEKFNRDAQQMYYKLFTKQEEWVEVIEENEVDIYKAMDCSAENLLNFFQGQSRNEVLAFGSSGKMEEIAKIITTPAGTCVVRQLKGRMR